MINPNLINQSCDLIKETSSKLPHANSSNNSTIISSIENACQNSSYLSSNNLINNDKQSIQTTPISSITPIHQLSSNNLRQIALSPISIDRLTARSDIVKQDNELLSQLTPDELIFRIKSLEAKNRKLLFENGNLVKNLNSSIENIQYLKKDNSELRDLCCYLDDERNRLRQMQLQWNSLGNHMSKILEKEINNYSQKLSLLESKQFELVKENYELKQLCLLLDKSSIKGELNNCNNNEKLSNNDNRSKNKNATSDKKSILNTKLMNYIKSLENKLDEIGQKILNKSDFKIELNLNELKQKRPLELDKAMEIFNIELELNESNNNELKSSEINDSNLVDDSNSINEDQKLIIKQLCSAAYKKIEEGDD